MVCLHAASLAAEAAGAQPSARPLVDREAIAEKVYKEMNIVMPPSLSFEPHIQVSQRLITPPCLQACMPSHVCAQ